ncbi:hypothetical protein ABD440_22830 [Chromobacterium piscinae]|uniref:P-type ATPase n=1 Tax=Chromobacterium piscinae TaxID=686831 RepID=UPI0031FE23DB
MSSRNLSWNVALLAMPAAALLLALIRQAWGGGGDVSPLLLSSALPMLGVLLFDAAGALKRRQIGVDVLAVLSIAVAIALEEQATAAVVAAMAATGRLLDTFAAGKAAREMAALLQRAPRLAHRLDGEALSAVAIEEIRPGDVLLVMQGEMVPVDGPLVGEEAALDESPLTGESLPVRLQAGGWLRSGAINAGDSLRMIGSDQHGGYVTPMEATGNEMVWVSRLRKHGKTLGLWVSADNVKAGAALHCVRVAEILAGQSALM